LNELNHSVLSIVVSWTPLHVGLQVGKDVISLITTREDVDNLLKLDDVIDLVIPRGSNALVTHIQQNTKIAVLGHADGICHIYIDPDCDINMACKICIDSKIDYPAACNAVEKVLVHEALAKDGRVSHSLWPWLAAFGALY